MKVIIVMGVSGSGKTTVGELLAKELHIPFKDADDFHPKENVSKMSNGIPLNDNDRIPWLELLSEKIEGWSKERGAVLACSALKEKYRTILASKGAVSWVYLKGSKDLIASRMSERAGHFMKPELLDSQFNDLEEPTNSVEVDISRDSEQIIKDLKQEFLK